MADLSSYASTLGIKPPKGPPAGSGIVTADQQRPDTQDGSPSDLAELRQAIATAKDPAAKSDLQGILAEKTQGQLSSQRLSPYAQALGLSGDSQAGGGRGMMPASAYERPAPAEPGLPVMTSDLAKQGVLQPAKKPGEGESIGEKALGAGEASLAMLTGIPAGLYGAWVGLVRGEPAGVKAAQFATYAPRTEAGQRYTENAGQVLHDSGIAGVAPLNEFRTMIQASRPATRAVGDAARSTFADAADAFKARGGRGATPPPQIEPTMAPPAEKPLYRRIDGEWKEVPKGGAQEAAAKPVTSAAVAEGEKLKPITITFDSPPVEGGVPKQVVPDRAAVLKRVGLEDVRTSAVTGDAAKAGQDFQVSKYTSEPAGLAAKAQFDAERQALVNHGEKSIQSTGGTIGLDQDTVNVRGQTITKPFDALREHFNNAKSALYAEADKRSAGAPTINVGDIENVLNDRTFNNSAMAQNKGHLVSAVKNQLELFKENNPGGMTVKNVEEFNQWLNKNWSPENAPIIAEIRRAADDAVTKGAGDDLYAQARQLHKLEKATLDNPNGVSKLMDYDPQTPINRVTPYDKVPDTLSRLPPAQLKNVLDTLKGMPEELQPQANAAISEIQAHYANKMLDAGTNNKGQWNAKRVSDFRKANSANISSAFENNPQALGMLNDLESAGHILDYPSSYPGASAQAAQAMKRGLMSSITQKAGAFTGGGIGGFMAGPIGGAAGAAVGDAIASRAGQSMAEKAALKRWSSGVTKLKDFPVPSGGGGTGQ